MIIKNEKTLKIVYGMALENAGIKNALNDIGDLLKGNHKFREFFPSEAEFVQFQTLFIHTLSDLSKIIQWDYNGNSLAIPDGDNTLTEYYNRLREVTLQME